MNNFAFITMLAMIFMGTLMITTAWDNHRRMKLRQRTVELRRHEIEMRRLEISTAVMLIRQGVRPVPDDERILEIGDGYVVSQDPAGKKHVTYLNNERLH